MVARVLEEFMPFTYLGPEAGGSKHLLKLWKYQLTWCYIPEFSCNIKEPVKMEVKSD